MGKTLHVPSVCGLLRAWCLCSQGECPERDSGTSQLVLYNPGLEVIQYNTWHILFVTAVTKLAHLPRKKYWAPAQFGGMTNNWQIHKTTIVGQFSVEASSQTN